MNKYLSCTIVLCWTYLRETFYIKRDGQLTAKTTVFCIYFQYSKKFSSSQAVLFRFHSTLSTYLSIYLFIYLSIYLSIYYLYIYLYTIYLFIYLSINLSTYLQLQLLIIPCVLAQSSGYTIIDFIFYFIYICFT